MAVASGSVGLVAMTPIGDLRAAADLASDLDRRPGPCRGKPTLVLRVSIHCEGCKKKVKKVLQSVDGVYRWDVDARSNKATVAITGNVSADALVKRLRRSGKHAEQWPEQQQHHADTQSSGQTKNEAAEQDKPADATEKAGSGSGDSKTNAVEPRNPKASPEESDTTAGETAKPAQDGTKSTNADAGADPAASHGTKEATAEQCEDKQQEKEDKAVNSVVVVAASGQGSHASGHLTPPLQQPVHVMSYSVARSSASAAYYAAAPAARSPPSQEHPYSSYPPCYHHYSKPSPYTCYHHGRWTPQTSAASPARDSYGDLFSDDNANSCSLM